MGRQIDAAIGLAEGVARVQPSLGRRLLRLAKQQPLGAIGGACLLVLVLAAIFAEQISPYGPFTMIYADKLKPISTKHLLGTDQFGRDLFSRIVHGSRLSLGIGLASVTLGTILGAFFGLISGYWGATRIDTIIQRLMDSLMALPSLILAIAIMAVLGISIINVMIAIGVVLVPRNSRVVRGAVLSTRENQYVEAARVIGCKDARILLYHILPNVVAPIIVLATVELGNAIMTEASLSFLGYGIPPPHPSWGGILSLEGRAFMEMAPWVAIFPGIALSLAVLGFNLFGDSLRDVLDPRLRQ